MEKTMYNDKIITAVVMARKGSKGLPGKSYRDLNGLPCFFWSVKDAYESEYIDTVIISCSCEVVKDRFNEFKHTLPIKEDKFIYYIDRPEMLNGPLVKNEEVLKHAYKKAWEDLTVDSDYLLTLQSTSPIRNNGLIDNCIEKMFKEKADSLVTVSKHFDFTWKPTNDGAVCPNGYYLNRPMRQQIKKDEFLYIDNGNVYITSKQILFSKDNRLGGVVSMYECDKFQSLQIDDEKDWTLVEAAIKNL
jgi:CMP-N,N'-diacetyllegionaminic acid synthase